MEMQVHQVPSIQVIAVPEVRAPERSEPRKKKPPCYVLRSRLKLKLLMMDVLLIGLESLFPWMSRARPNDSCQV